MARVVVTGVAGPVGQRVWQLVRDDPDVDEVIALDRADPPTGSGDERWTQLALVDADLGPVFDGADVVLHLAGSDPLQPVDPDRDLVSTSRVLDAAAAAGVRQLVIRTSATVYGARPDNAVPLTEAAPLRPNPESPWVIVRSEIERRVEAFRAAHPSVTVAVLRPCVTVCEDGPDGLGRVLAADRMVTPTEGAPPAQFVHADDVAAAVDLARREKLDGVFNVAPDGWLDAELIRALVGGTPRLPLPAAWAAKVTHLGWRLRLAPTPPGFLPFVQHPWVVANDHLRSFGWVPTHTNEEAFVAGHAAAPWATISPRRRQELALALAAGAVVGGVAATAALVRRQLRHRR